MRSLTANLATEIAKSFGVEPINIIEIQWVDGGSLSAYSDRDISGVPGRIVEISGLDFVINVSDGTDSAQVSLTLSDTVGDLKTIIDQNDIHKRPVWIYQLAEGLSLADKSLVFRGEVNSPITWNEGDRTLKINVISKIEDAEIGFSIEEGQFPSPPPELIGKPWPLKFGTTINVPALRFTSPTKGVLSTGIGISDFTLAFRLFAAEKIICPLVFRGYLTRYTDAFQRSISISPVYSPDESCALNRCETIANLERMIAEQVQYEFSQIVIIDGEKFPQGVQITLDIDGGKFTGSFLGTPASPSNIFAIVAKKHPKQDEIGIPTTASVNAILVAKRTTAVTEGCAHLTGGNDDGVGGTTVSVGDTTDESRRLVEQSEKSLAFYNAVPTSEFFWANPGATVTLDTGEPLVYVTNLLPETIHSVAAFRTFDAGRKLVTVPVSFYTVRAADFDSYTTTEVVLDLPLSRLADGWEDELYITSTSSVGPNTVDIIEWLIEKYTSHAIDSASFASVRAAIDNYPSDFPILERKNILQVLEEIVFQARCAIYLRDGTFFLKYLPLLPSSDSEINESDIDSNSFEIFHSPTEDIVTKMDVSWQRDYSLDDQNRIILRHNIKKYGTQEQEFNFYIFNELDYVHKAATFWLIRKSNTWRQARFSTPIHKLALETFDAIDLNVVHFAPAAIRCLITKADYNSDSRQLDFEVWSPVLSGTTVAYDFAYPSNIDPELYWPTLNERNAGLIGSGDAPGFAVTPPAGHPLSGDLGLIQGFSLGPCNSQAAASVIQKFRDDPTKFDFQKFGFNPFELKDSFGCGTGNGDISPSDTGDSKKTKSLERGLPPGSPVDPGQINVGTATNLINLGGNSESDELKRRIGYVELSAALAKSVAHAANEAAGGNGSGNQPLPDNPFNALPEVADVEDPCASIVTVYVGRVTLTFDAGSGSPFTPPGSIATYTLERTDQFAFANCCEARQLVSAINQHHLARQNAANYNINDVVPVQAILNACNTTAPCTDKTPCEGQNRDEAGNPTGKTPTPIGYTEDIMAAPPMGFDPGSPADYWSGDDGDEDMTDGFDASQCARTPEACPPEDEEEDDEEPGTPTNPGA